MKTVLMLVIIGLIVFISGMFLLSQPNLSQKHYGTYHTIPIYDTLYCHRTVTTNLMKVSDTLLTVRITNRCIIGNVELMIITGITTHNFCLIDSLIVCGE